MMNDAVEKIREWAREVEEYDAVPWERLPEIDLYMDQVITYMDNQLHLFQRTQNNKLLTSSMINNYVKDKVLERPEQKKYSRDHLAMLIVICMLKPVLAIQDVSSLLKYLMNNESKTEFYTTFCSSQTAALKEVCERVQETSEKGQADLARLAIALSIEANARRTAAERIVSELTALEREKEAAEKNLKKQSKTTK